MAKAFAIILAGGNGDRFWPLSTPEKPKQFLSIFSSVPLIRQAVDRLDGLFTPENIFIITASRFESDTRKAVPQLPKENIILEPCRRETAAAVATACAIALRKGGEDSVGCILTADHLISPKESFQQTLKDSIDVASKEDVIVTMGITPTRAETGFGYIETDSVCDTKTATTFRAVKRFVEKPNDVKANEYLKSGNFLWNAGMFIWQAKTLRMAFEKYAPSFCPLISEASREGDIATILDKLYASMPTISFDFAVMEYMQKILVAESSFVWDDVGSWLALERHFEQTSEGNTIIGSLVSEENKSSILVNASNKNHRLVVAGVSDIVVVETPDATLVCSKSELEKMKSLVAAAIKQ